MNTDSVMMDRELGFRYFSKGDGKVYETVPTGVLDKDGKMTYKDVVRSESGIDASAALTSTEYKLVDSVVNDERKNPNRVTQWLLSLGANVVRFDGMKYKTYWYKTVTGKTASRSTMDLEDDSPSTTIEIGEDGVPLPLEFADWQTNIRRDPSASTAAGMNLAAEKARISAEAVGKGLDLRQINGWGGLTYKGVTVRGIRDLPTTLTVAQAGTVGGGGWLASSVTTTEIYANIRSMVQMLNQNNVPGPYVLVLPESFRFRLAETFSTSVNGDEKSLWMKLLERPNTDVPNVLNISQVKLVSEMDQLKGGGTPTAGEAYLFSLDPKWFRVLNYLPMQSFTIDLKGGISTKHRIAEGVCPLWKKNSSGLYGFVKLVAPVAP